MAQKRQEMTTSLINSEERNALVAEEILQFAQYQDNYPFVLGLSARPLATLFDAALCGSRVYELMTISRPADMFHYLYLNFVDVHPRILKYVDDFSGKRAGYDNAKVTDGMTFTAFDPCFFRDADGTPNFCRAWLELRDSDFWKTRLQTLLALTKCVQHRLRQVDDLLLKNEIDLIDRQIHRRDLFVEIERMNENENTVSRTTTLPVPLYETIISLVKEGKVNSVSCPLNDFALWRALVEEQVCRAKRFDQNPRADLYLSGSDAGINCVPEDWGGSVHIPFEGATSAELFIKPDWHNFRSELAGKGGSLYEASFSKALHYMLTQQDFGELGCAVRTQIGEWTLYENKERLMFSLGA